ncbi:MAG: hypothetical protein NXI20_02890 [bacterium]|nr:hypothetical protein [bacterium]
MKILLNHIALVVCVMASSTLIAQKRTYPVQLPSFSFFNENYKISAELTGYDEYKIKIEKEGATSPEEFTLTPLTAEKFQEIVVKRFNNLHGTALSKDENDKLILEINQLFYAFRAADIAINNLDDTPDVVDIDFSSELYISKNIQDINRRVKDYIKTIKKYKQAQINVDGLTSSIDSLQNIYLGNNNDDLTKRKEYLKGLKEIIIKRTNSKPNLVNKDIDKILIEIEKLETELSKDEFDLEKETTKILKLVEGINTTSAVIERYQFLKDWSHNSGKFIYRGRSLNRRRAKKLLKKQIIESTYSETKEAYLDKKQKYETVKSLQSKIVEMEGQDRQNIKDQVAAKASISKLRSSANKKKLSINQYYAFLSNLSSVLLQDNQGPFETFLRTVRESTDNNINEDFFPNEAQLIEWAGLSAKISSLNPSLNISRDSLTSLTSKQIDSIYNNRSDQTDLNSLLAIAVNKKHFGYSYSIDSISQMIQAVANNYKFLIENTKSITDLEQEIKNYEKLISSNKETYDQIASELNIPLDKKSVTKSVEEAKALLLDSKRDLPQINLKIKEIEMEFNNGFIENMHVIGIMDINGTEPSENDSTSEDPIRIKLENYNPIGFSRKYDFNRFNKIFLFGSATISGEILEYKLRLSDLFPLINETFAVDRRDYSPKNGVTKIVVDPTKEKLSLSLTKEKTSRLFEARVYSDFIGFDQDNPNGLIQTEISKNLPIITRRHYWTAVKVNWGFLNFVEPFVILSKLEESNKNLGISNLNRFISGDYEPIKYARTLDLKQRESFSTGFLINAVTLDVPLWKSTVELSSFFSYGITPAQDSIRTFVNNEVVTSDNLQEFRVDTYSAGPEVNWIIKTDERYRFHVTYRHNLFWARNNDFIQVAELNRFEENRDKGNNRHQFNSVELGATLKTSETSSGRLFFRYRYNWQQDFWRTGFNQVQVGYSFYILGRNEQSTPQSSDSK